MLIDTNSSCLGKSNFLKKKGITAVGRYYRVLHQDWAITKDEAQELSSAGIKLVMVYEDTGHRKNMDLSNARGKKDASNALKQSHNIGQPNGTVIYFALEGLDDGYNENDLDGIRDYFTGVKNTIKGEYKLGVYGDGLVCETLLNEDFCKYTWLAAARAHPGSRKFYKSGLWNIAQKVPVDVTEGWNGLSIDTNETHEEFGAFLLPAASV